MVLSEIEGATLRDRVDRTADEVPLSDAIDRLLQDDLVQRDVRDRTGSVIFTECRRRLTLSDDPLHNVAVAKVYAELWTRGAPSSLARMPDGSRPV